ncbi:PDZ domain-containing protein [Streptomyces sp. BA2]|nr:PDZ domain-containing protein [Streptomyces sp. BA2]
MPGQDPGGGGKFGRGGRGGRFAIGRRLGIGRKAGAGRPSGAGSGAGSGSGPGAGRRSGSGHRPHAARRRGRRLVTLLFGLLFSAVLVLSGIGLGTVSATVIGMSKLADMQKEAQAQAGAKGPGGPAAPGAASKPAAPPLPQPPRKEPDKPGERAAARPTLGVEAVDAPQGAGALLVGVHSPGPGYTAGLVRGDVLLAFGKTRVASAKALAAAVAAADPGRNVTVTVRHASGERQFLSVTPGFVT